MQELTYPTFNVNSIHHFCSIKKKQGLTSPTHVNENFTFFGPQYFEKLSAQNQPLPFFSPERKNSQPENKTQPVQKPAASQGRRQDPSDWVLRCPEWHHFTCAWAKREGAKERGHLPDAAGRRSRGLCPHLLAAASGTKSAGRPGRAPLNTKQPHL